MRSNLFAAAVASDFVAGLVTRIRVARRRGTWKHGLGGALVAGALSLGWAPVAQAAPTLSFSTSPTPAVVGTPLTVNVLIDGIADLYAYQFSLSFDPAVLSATAVTEGSFLSGAGSTFFGGGTIDNTSGEVSFVFDSLIGAIPGASGSGTLVHIGFNVLAPGISALTLSDVLFLDSSLNEISLQVMNGSVLAVAAVPEPTTLAMMCLGLVGLSLVRRRAGRVHRLQALH